MDSSSHVCGFQKDKYLFDKNKVPLTCLVAQSIQLQMMDAYDGVAWGALQGLS